MNVAYRFNILYDWYVEKVSRWSSTNSIIKSQTVCVCVRACDYNDDAGEGSGGVSDTPNFFLLIYWKKKSSNTSYRYVISACARVCVCLFNQTIHKIDIFEENVIEPQLFPLLLRYLPLLHFFFVITFLTKMGNIEFIESSTGFVFQCRARAMGWCWVYQNWLWYLLGFRAYIHQEFIWISMNKRQLLSVQKSQVRQDTNHTGTFSNHYLERSD